MSAFEERVRPLPAAMWPMLQGFPGGYVALVADDRSRYQPGPASIRGQSVDNVAFVSVQDLARDNERPLHVLGHLIDHHLGCGGGPTGAWLSDGGGTTQQWQEAGARLARLFALGYGADEVARSNLHDYFAQSLALYCREQKRLNAADPQIEKWLRNTIWSDLFWHSSPGVQL